MRYLHIQKEDNPKYAGTVLQCMGLWEQENPAVCVGLMGKLRVPLDGPEEFLCRHVERLRKSVGGDGHTFKPRRQGFHRLVVVAVYRQMIDP